MTDDSQTVATRRAFGAAVLGSLIPLAGCAGMSTKDYRLESVAESDLVNSIELENLAIDDGYYLQIDAPASPRYNAIVALDRDEKAINACEASVGYDPELFIPGDNPGTITLLFLAGSTVDCFGDECSASGGEKLGQLTVEVAYAE